MSDFEAAFYHFESPFLLAGYPNAERGLVSPLSEPAPEPGLEGEGAPASVSTLVHLTKEWLFAA